MNRRGITGKTELSRPIANQMRSNQVVREAREFLIATNRPETPRHSPGSDKWKSYYEAGDHIARIDKLELRPITKQNIRLDPIGSSGNKTENNATPKRPRGSANDRLERLVHEYGGLPAEDRHTISEKFARAIEKVVSQSEGVLTNKQRESLLANCAEVLELSGITNHHRYGVCQIMFQLHLGPINLSVLGATLVAVLRDLDFCVARPAIVAGIVAHYHNGDRYFIQALFELIKFDPTLQLCLKQKQLIRQLRRCLTRLIHQNRENEPETEKETTAKVCMVLETIRRLMDVTSFFSAVERSCLTQDKLESEDLNSSCEHEVSQGRMFIETWLHCCQEFPSNRLILLNLARLLSISTTSELICSNFSQPAASLVMAQSMESFINDNDMMVRYLYALGNCLAADVRARQLNTKLPRSIRRILSHYLKKSNQGKTICIAKDNCDVILKVIRLIANFSLDEAGAAAVLAEQSIVALLLKLLRTAVRNGDTVAESDEIAKSCLASLNNLIYFAKDQFSPFIDDCTDAFITCLMNSNLKITSECCRALGNLSHFPSVVQQFRTSGADKILFTLLDSSDIELVVNVIGIFINFTLRPVPDEPQSLKLFTDFRKLLRAIKEFNDWRVSNLTLQLIWNLVRNQTQINGKLRSEIISTIDYINEEASPPQDYTEAQDQRLFGEISEKLLEILGS